MGRIAVIGQGCRYPGVGSPEEFWGSVVAGRRGFRLIPAERMPLGEYFDPDPSAPDKFYSPMAAVLDDFEFDRVRFKITGSTFRSTDLTHWLTLDTVANALIDAGFPDGEGIDRERTGVIIGNTLTGEFSRANVMRLRWPYVARVVREELAELDPEDVDDLLVRLEQRYKRPFPPIDEDTLAGGLANTIAGRICNYYDFKGGGYTVDGACSSSLLSVTTASQYLTDGELDVAIAGGVDLSIDPFEIIGFAKTGALARSQMRMYDAGSNGFWPGEGCGVVVLMREEDAAARGLAPYGFISGWGISSDGHGGITRPEVAGYQLALSRAYERAGVGIETVPYFEGHGTGTVVGDQTELSSINGALHAAGAQDRAYIGSIKGQFGHTKAAAGIAGLMRALHAVHHGVIPPTVGCLEPHPEFEREDSLLRPAMIASPWPEGAPLRAGVTSMGFGGINAHVVVESDASDSDWENDEALQLRSRGKQDVELLPFEGDTPAELESRLREAASALATAAYYEVQDYSSVWTSELGNKPLRAAVVADSPKQASERLAKLAEVVSEADLADFTIVPGVGFCGTQRPDFRIGAVFPGQGTGSSLLGGAVAHRFRSVNDLYNSFARRGPSREDAVETRVAQPWTFLGSMAGLRALSEFGVEPHQAMGHSLGEVTALCWAGSLTVEQALELATQRGALMSQHSLPGSMCNISADEPTTRELIQDTDVVVAAINSPRHTVVAGSLDGINEIERRTDEQEVPARALRVSHAFHSPLVAPAEQPFGEFLKTINFEPLAKAVTSTVTGQRLDPNHDLTDLLIQQLTKPVRFLQALSQLNEEVDLVLEIGPGSSMTQLANAADITAMAVNTDDPSLRGLLSAVAAAWVGGAEVDMSALHQGRLERRINSKPVLLTNPTESTADYSMERAPSVEGDGSRSPLEVLIELAASWAELPPETVSADSRMIEDLHMSSITVGQILTQVGQAVGLSAVTAPINMATATIGELAEAFEKVDEEGTQIDPLGDSIPPWIGTWQQTLQPLPPLAPLQEAASEGGNDWTLVALGDSYPQCSELAALLSSHLPQGGIFVSLPSTFDLDLLEEAFEAAKKASQLEHRQPVVFYGGPPALAALAKTVYLEHPRLTVLSLSSNEFLAPEIVVAETADATSFSEVVYNRGTRLSPNLVPSIPEPGADHCEGGVVLAVGGGKGITAACAMALAASQKSALGIIGRSDPRADPEVQATLAQAVASGIPIKYAQADVQNPHEVNAAVESVSKELGSITDIIYGAGVNRPQPLSSLNWDETRQTISIKRDGLSNVLRAVDHENLRSLASFGSLIGRFGLWGEAHYAMANAELASVTRRFGKAHPHVRAVCFEWTVWADIGMGDRLNVVESLVASGVTALSPAQGIQILLDTLSDPNQQNTTLIVAGRTDNLPTATYEAQELPFLRFLEIPKRHYPDHALVTDVVLNPENDPYLLDHTLDGNYLMPAVMGMEAMLQSLEAVSGPLEGPVTFRDIQFLRPIVVPPHGLRIRIATSRNGQRGYDTVILTEETNFTTPHFTSRILLDGKLAAAQPELSTRQAHPVPLDPETDLYQKLLFQGDRFQRISGYHDLGSRFVVAELAGRDADWFSTQHPGKILSGDPGVRDAAMHGNQVSVPDSTLLPEKVSEIVVAPKARTIHQTVSLLARETHHEGNLHIYDLDLRDSTGETIETWRGLHLRAVNKSVPNIWHSALLGPHIERALADAGCLNAHVSLRPGEGHLKLSAEGPQLLQANPIPLQTGSFQPEMVSQVLKDLLQVDELEHAGTVRGGEHYRNGSGEVLAFPAQLEDCDSAYLVVIQFEEKR